MSSALDEKGGVGAGGWGEGAESSIHPQAMKRNENPVVDSKGVESPQQARAPLQPIRATEFACMYV